MRHGNDCHNKHFASGKKLSMVEPSSRFATASFEVNAVRNGNNTVYLKQIVMVDFVQDTRTYEANLARKNQISACPRGFVQGTRRVSEECLFFLSSALWEHCDSTIFASCGIA